jgi:acyl-CoA synthetase (NDP forming)
VQKNNMHEQYGFQSPVEALATSADQAAQLAARMGFPVVLKIASPDILHKTDICGVALDLRTEDEVRQAFQNIQSVARAAQPQDRFDGVQVQERLHGSRDNWID